MNQFSNKDFSLFQIPPLNNDKTFENLILDLFNDIEKTNSYSKYGTKGQNQKFIDIYSVEKETVIQCKCYDINKKNCRKELLKKLEEAVEGFKYSELFKSGKFKHFIYAVSFPDDTTLSDLCISLSTKELQIIYWSWNKIVSNISKAVYEKYNLDFLMEYAILENNIQSTTNISSDKNKTVESLELQSQQFMITNNLISYNTDNHNSIIEKIFNYFKYAYYELSFNNIEFLIEHKLFNTNEGFKHNSFPFTLTTNNTEVFDFFSDIIINENGKYSLENINKYSLNKKVAEKKIDFIVNTLVRNDIKNIYNSDKRNYTGIPINILPKPRKEILNFLNFKHKSLIKALSSEKRKDEDIETQAFLKYKLGEYTASAILFLQLSKSYQSKKKYLKEFICLYNLTKLKRFIKYERHTSKTLEILKEIEKIDISQESVRLSLVSKSIYIDWINNNKFFDINRNKVQFYTNQIRDHYHSQLNGGWSNNNYVWEMISCYSETFEFIFQNKIVFDEFSDFSQFADTFFEGLFASHAIELEQTCRLQYFDNWMLLQMVLYGNADNLLKYYRRYKQPRLSYAEPLNSEEHFVNIICNFLSKDDVSFINKSEQRNNYDFLENDNKYFQNFLVIASICDFNKSHINKIARALISYLDNEDVIFNNKYEYSEIFFKSNGKYIDTSILRNFLSFSLLNNNYHDSNIFEVLTDILVERKFEIKLSQKEMDYLVSLIEICQDCKKAHNNYFVLFFPRVLKNREQKELLTEKIISALQRNPKRDFIYLALILELITPQSEAFDLFINLSKIKGKTADFRQIFARGHFPYDRKIQGLVNVCYKYNLNLKDKKFDDFRGIHPYYDWLLDMEGFDYEKFDPKWVKEHATIFYIKKMKNHRIIRCKLQQYIKNNNDPQVQVVLNKISFDEDIEIVGYKKLSHMSSFQQKQL